MNHWFRMYAEFSSDPKIRTMSDALQIRLVRLFCLRCTGLTEKLSCDELKYGMGCNDDETFLETKIVFLSKGFIDENWEILHWSKRQFISDSSRDRVNKFRAKQALKRDETFQERDETFQERDETQNETHQTRPEQSRAEQKPSRAKKVRAKKPKPEPGDAKEPTKSDIAAGRHVEAKDIIGEYWASKNPGVQMPWDGREGKQLEMFLRAAPDITAAQLRGFLRNRFQSDVNHGERPSMWIQWVTSYASGPIDRYGKTVSKENLHVVFDKNKQSPASQRVEDNLRAVAETAVRRGWVSADIFERPDAAEMAEPGPGGIDR